MLGEIILNELRAHFDETVILTGHKYIRTCVQEILVTNRITNKAMSLYFRSDYVVLHYGIHLSVSDPLLITSIIEFLKRELCYGKPLAKS